MQTRKTKVSLVNEGAEKNNQFALDFYQQVATSKQGNFCVAPVSVSTALAMAAMGADGETERELLRLLAGQKRDGDLAGGDLAGGELVASEFHEQYGDLKIHVQQIDSKNKNLTLQLANQMWGQKEKAFADDFLEMVDEKYDATLVPADFQNEPDSVADEINQWVKKGTKGKIDQIVAGSDFTDLTRLVLVNVIYLKADWQRAFSEQLTRKSRFSYGANKSALIDMMRQEGEFPFANHGNFKILSLPYAGDDLSMVFLLPKRGKQLSEIESMLTAEKLKKWIANAGETDVDVKIPKFKIESQFELSQQLRTMGAKKAFSNAADFSKTGQPNLYITQVFHKTFLEVNESGSEAAAATLVAEAEKSEPGGGGGSGPEIFHADRPFLYLIQENSTGCILFMGRFSEPN